MKFCFCILHYKAVEETLTCVDSILQNYDKAESAVVIVDNGSGDGSAEVLQREYGKKRNIDIIALEKNLGFSAGNNVGCKFAIEKYNPHYLIVANNDIIFSQKEFLEKLEELYEHSKFVVAGPDIFNRVTKEHQSPMRADVRNLKQIDNWYKKNLSIYNHTRYWYIKNLIFKILHKVYCKSGIRGLSHKIRNIDKERDNIYRENVCISGACLIFEQAFWKDREKIFFPETFLYCEEDILIYQCKELNYKVVYDPELRVIHGESVATRASHSSVIDKMRYCAKQNMNSCEVYKNLITSNIK